MSVRSSLAGAVSWLRAGYSTAAPERGYNPLIALMPGKDAGSEHGASVSEHTAPHPSRARGKAAKRWRT